MERTEDGNEMDRYLIDAINRMNGETFKALTTKLLSSMGLEIISSEFEDERGIIEAKIGEEIPEAEYSAYFIRVERRKEVATPEELQDFFATRKGKDMGTIFISTADFTEDAKIYAREFEIEIVDDNALAALVRKFDLLPDVMIYRDREILKTEKGRFLPSIDELENILEKGTKAYARGNYPEALRYFTRAAQLKPNYDTAWYMRGVILSNIERYEEALDSFMKALESNIENENTWYNMGLTLYSLGRYDEEMQCYDRAISLKKDFLNAWNNKGTTLLQLERIEKAMECFDEILKYDPNFKMAWNNKGIALKKLKRGEEAMECFTKAIKIDPNYLDPWLNKGMVLLNSKRYKEAYQCFEAALYINGKNIQGLYGKGRTLEGVGQYSKAIECYDRIIHIEPEYKAAKRRKKKASKSFEMKGDSTIDEDFFRLEWKKIDEHRIMKPEGERILVEKKVVTGAELEEDKYQIRPSAMPEPLKKAAPPPVQPAKTAEAAELKKMKDELEDKARDLAKMEATLGERYENIEKEALEMRDLKTMLEKTREHIEREKIRIRTTAEELKDKANRLALAEEDFKGAEKRLKEEQAALERERSQLMDKTQEMASKEDMSRKEQEALEQKLSEIEKGEKDIKTAEEVLAKERIALKVDEEKLERERKEIAEAKDELKSKKGSIHSKEEEISKRYEEMEEKIEEMKNREKELEKMAEELKVRQEDLEVQAKILEDKERSLEEDIKIRAEERIKEEKEKEEVQDFLKDLEKYSEPGEELPKTEEILKEASLTTPIAEEAEGQTALELPEEPIPYFEEIKPLERIFIEEFAEEIPVEVESDIIKEISALYALKHFDEALELIEKSLQQGPESKLLWILKGNMVCNKKDYDEAYQCYGNALRLDQNDVVALTNLMALSMETGRNEEANEWCERVLALRPTDQRFIIDKALLKFKSGQIDEALSALEELLEVNDELEDIWILKGIILHSLNRDDEAMSCFNRVLSISPEHPVVWNNKGVLLYKAEKYGEALECFNNAIELMPFERIKHNIEVTAEKTPESTGEEEIAEVEEAGIFNEVITETEKLVEIPEELPEEKEEAEEGAVSLYMCPSCGAFVSKEASKCEKCGYDFEEEGREIDEEELDEEVETEETKEEIIEKFMKISGVGHSKAENLYGAGYGSYESLRKASFSDLAEVGGIGKSLARKIKNQLKGKKFKDD